MTLADSTVTDIETLEHLLGVITENREQHCAKVREAASKQATDIIKQAHISARQRMHRHVSKLREKYQQRISSVQARNQTLIRQQQHAADRVLLDAAWPLLVSALRKLWSDYAVRQKWHDTALKKASSVFVSQDWRIEHPADFSDEDRNCLRRNLKKYNDRQVELLACGDIAAGIRIIAQGTVVDATAEGLLRHREKIEGVLIARIRQGMSNHV